MRFADLEDPPVEAHQNRREFGALWDLVASRPHARVLEIGSLYGGTLWWWSKLPQIETLVSVDLASDQPRVRDGVREARSHWPEWFAGIDFVDVAADSHAPRTIETVGHHLDGQRFDLAFIDGDHTYDGVRGDWILWSPLISGIVAFHDTWPNGHRHEPGIVAWVDELRHQLPSIEWTDPDGVGICAFTV